MEQPNNLNTFRILFIVKGVLSIFMSLFALLYIFMGVFAFNQFTRLEPNMPFNPGIIFIIVGSILFIFLITVGILDLVSAKHLKYQTGYNFIFVSSIIGCLTGILGILLCVFTLIELSKPHVKPLFEKS